jgi:hypothetical protein
VRAAGWVSYHGVALNVCSDLLEAFSHIVPCGIGDRPVGSVASALGVGEGEEEEGAALLAAHADALVAAVGRVFAADLAPPGAVAGRVGRAAAAAQAALAQAAAEAAAVPETSAPAEVGA